MVQFEGVAPEAPPRVTYAPVDLEGHVGVVVDIPRVVYELVRLVVHLVRCLYAEYGGGLRHPLHAYTYDLSLGLQYSRPNAADTTTIPSNIFLSCSVYCETTPASSAFNMPRSDVVRAGSPTVCFSQPPREGDVKQEGREHAPSVMALFHREPPLAHSIVE